MRPETLTPGKGSRQRFALVDGILTGARQRPSPNCDERPDPQDISLLVIHNISLPPGVYGGHHVDDLFLNRLDPAAHPYFEGIKDLRVSAHLFVSREGAVTQYVPLGRRAWHAGVSRFEGRERCNDYSIGIELEGTDAEPFTEVQYEVLAVVSRLILVAYPRITPERIAGHSEIAPGRKTDPGPCFDWERFRRSLALDLGSQ